ncbi:MAG: GNAT family N-acetyltransferase [Thermoplasmata archaeon]
MAGLSYRPKGRESRAETERQMALDPEMWLGCFIGGELAGVVVGSYDSRKGWMNRLAVVPQHRRKGVANALVREMERLLRARGFGIIGVLVNDDNEASLSLFRESGYETLDHILYLRKLDDPDI